MVGGSILGLSNITLTRHSLFPTIDIPGLGTFQDGGMRRHNNPINLALSEAKHLWPNCPSPDVFISLGTGSETGSQSPVVSKFRNVLLDGWLPRVYRSVSSSFEGQNNWKEFLGIMDEKSQAQYFRFDLSIPSGLPRLDNTECMDRLSSLVRANISSDRTQRDAAISLLATSFFFCLDTKPKYFSGLLQCVGSIRCRAPARDVIQCLDKISTPKEFYKDAINLGLQLTTDDICQYCDRYFRPVRFIVRDVKDTITLSLRFGGEQHRLSAFPNKIQWFAEQQGLEWSFGSLDHRVDSSRRGCPMCEGQQAGRLRKRKHADI
ncbi:Patatin-like serine hydrolase, putative [Penicillium digitatum PHI26]|uniref:Patatin-like serine hydrolase, putative n=2 Tax=Penicillium digitatum TaxID=36651 RepID=K9G6V0_PEND2|nr:Patatin-like serine hydrolase, putative [Penicillium digitatum Pd1]EKV15737.1 Patatin-like serine hydrolase, putative [Penicillium digitatum Pd1]EKV17680.1 Patatin-like serine hydrolase, putative [Penicillium digitatum PHI26]